jgi:hypothetical protein
VPHRPSSGRRAGLTRALNSAEAWNKAAPGVNEHARVESLESNVTALSILVILMELLQKVMVIPPSTINIWPVM